MVFLAWKWPQVRSKETSPCKQENEPALGEGDRQMPAWNFCFFAQVQNNQYS